MHVAGVPIIYLEPQDVATAAPAEVEATTVAASASFAKRAKSNSTALAIVKKTLEWNHSRNTFLNVLEPFTYQDELLGLLEFPFGKYFGKLYFEGELNGIKTFLTNELSANTLPSSSVISLMSATKSWPPAGLTKAHEYEETWAQLNAGQLCVCNVEAVTCREDWHATYGQKKRWASSDQRMGRSSWTAAWPPSLGTKQF